LASFYPTSQNTATKSFFICSLIFVFLPHNYVFITSMQLLDQLNTFSDDSVGGNVLMVYVLHPITSTVYVKELV